MRAARQRVEGELYRFVKRAHTEVRTLQHQRLMRWHVMSGVSHPKSAFSCRKHKLRSDWCQNTDWLNVEHVSSKHAVYIPNPSSRDHAQAANVRRMICPVMKGGLVPTEERILSMLKQKPQDSDHSHTRSENRARGAAGGVRGHLHQQQHHPQSIRDK